MIVDEEQVFIFVHVLDESVQIFFQDSSTEVVSLIGEEHVLVSELNDTVESQLVEVSLRCFHG